MAAAAVHAWPHLAQFRHGEGAASVDLTALRTEMAELMNQHLSEEEATYDQARSWFH